ncbi:tRNA (uridine(54)-C5)-methyltransferase TrmA [Campylobacter geochelonis]|uniref:tRNA (uridine(54)-C5)-methyltransferase TrmA n=1 Tax=Campylobacter geochelonis TaxID=1780362 RepID=UPI00094D9148|nr:tRNA (uridine(54)-C5)-methyltransferase TrmA [Campylobacter geochelonis]
MECKFTNLCGSCTLNLTYDEQKTYKLEKIRSKFKEFYGGEIEFFNSNQKHYRTRAEFGLYHENDELSYTMNGKSQKYLKIDQCPKVDIKIANLMPNLLKKLKENQALKHKIFGVEFIATKDEILVILLYHKDILSIEKELLNLKKELEINLIARSRGKKLVFGSDTLRDTLMVDGREFYYQFGDGAFIQPNKMVNEKMISWARGCVSDDKSNELFEMYCGHGNFTIPLSAKFKKVLANEISKSSIKNALKNCELNGVENIKFVRMSSEEIIEAFNGREFVRLKGIDINEYKFSHILVDPPRAGLETSVMEFIKNYENIIYISCNPDTLRENLITLCKTHKVVKFALFDQFAHTEHVECGVLLEKP